MSAWAVSVVHALERTIEDILRLARPETGAHRVQAACTVTTLVDELERRWHGPLAAAGRLLVIRLRNTDPAAALPGFVTAEVLTILLDNAVRHGTGRVEVSFRDLTTVVAVDAADEGAVTVPATEVFRRGLSGGRGLGIGLVVLTREVVDRYGVPGLNG